MLVINHKGNTPQQRFYSVGVKENNLSNKIVFVLEAKQSDVDLRGYVCNLKVKSKEGDYLDLILLDGVYSEKHKTLSFTWVMERKTTKYRNLELQLEFIDTNEDIVWQTQICELELSDTIKVGDEQPSDKELSALKQMEQKVVGFENELEATNERVDELAEQIVEQDEIIIGNPDEYLNENGLDKIIRVEDENGGVEKSYLIDKIHHESTLVVCEQHREENGFYYGGDFDAFVDDLGSEQFNEIFGIEFGINDLGNTTSLYYNKNGEITKGIKFGEDDFADYGLFGLIDCTPNKIIRVIVGKYFEYNEQGNKVFDEHCAIFSTNFVENPKVEYREITEEKQVFELKTSDEGKLYFDSHGSYLGFGNTRFILYGFEIGEPAYDEYEEHEIGGGSSQKSIPMFKQSQTLGELVEFYNARKDEFGENGCMSFGMYPDNNEWDGTTIGRISITPTTFSFSIHDEMTIYQFDGLISDYVSAKLSDLINNSTVFEYVNGSNINAYDIARRYQTNQEFDSIPNDIIEKLRGGDSVYSSNEDDTVICVSKDDNFCSLLENNINITRLYYYAKINGTWVFQNLRENVWFGTQEAYNALPTKYGDTTYYIYED